MLSEKEVFPLGADKPVAIDLTVVAASHHDLRELISAGTFREDLYYRLCGATLQLPPLRLRSDKRYLINKLLQEEAVQLGGDGRISGDAMHLLMQFPWPGNIRQLRNVLRFALALAENREIMPEDLPYDVLEQEWIQPHYSRSMSG